MHYLPCARMLCGFIRLVAAKSHTPVGVPDLNCSMQKKKLPAYGKSQVLSHPLT